MNRRPYVVYWNNLPAPYMVDRFNALADANKIDFEAWFTDRTHAERRWSVAESSWRFRYRYLPSIKVFGRRLHWPSRLFGRRPDVLVCLHARPVYIFGILIAKIRRTKVAIRVLKTFDNWIPRTRRNELLKKVIFAAADAIETPGADAREYAIQYGVDPERIYELTHTVSPLLLARAEQMTAEQIRKSRIEMQTQGTTFVYVGRLWEGKGLRHLLNAFRDAQSRVSEPISLILAGDGPEETDLRRLADDLGCENVVFIGFKQHTELASVLAGCDVFVFPTLGDPYGIVVDEAMALGLPVISSDTVGEIRKRIDDSVNGYIVPAANHSAMTDRMVSLATNTNLRQKMGALAKERVQSHTPSRWAQEFIQMIDKVLR